MSRLGLIVNPTSGKNTGARIGTEALTLLRAAGVEIVDLSAVDARSAMERGRAAISAGAVDAIVVAGGDGMVHLGANLCAGTGVPLGIIAAGTGNDIARELGLPVRDAGKSVERILDGGTRLVDVAKHTMPSGEDRWFLGVLAAGFDAVVNERANQWRWPKGPMRYNLAIMRELPVFRAIPYVLELDGTRMETEAMLVAVGNGPAYGGGMKVTPDALVRRRPARRARAAQDLDRGVPAGLPDGVQGHPHQPPEGAGAAGAHGAAGGDRHRVVRRRGALRAAADDHGGRARRAHRAGLSADVA